MHQLLRNKSFLILLFISLGCAQSYAQKEANIWYFGRFLGLDFNSGIAVPLNDGLTNTTEGVASISNSAGNLLFYTDGITVRNRLHQTMPNGNGLLGHPSSTQSAVIVPKIGDTTRYYIFTVAQLSGPDGLRYSVVNMNLDNGKGDVELKNVPLQSNVVEKITAVKHCNNRDIWVVSHGAMSDIYYAFLVTAAGVSPAPVISHTGVVLPGVVPPSPLDSTSLGYLKASPNGKKIAAAHWTVNADVSDFNNATGVVSNTVSLFQPGDPHYLVYGIDFSPNSNLLYATAFYTDPVNFQKRNALYQYDVSLVTPTDIRASKYVVSLNSDPIQTYAALQVAPDGKMYMAKNTYKHLARINNPDVYGVGCNYTSNAVQFSQLNQESSFGLPTFIQSYFYPVDSFSYVRNCPGTTVNFNYTIPASVSSILWNFGDPASGSANTSTNASPSHTFSSAGLYTVRLIKFTNCGPDTIVRQIQTDVLQLNLGADTVVCAATSLTLNGSATAGGNTFLWQDGSTNPTFLATTAGLFWVQVSNGIGCTKRDSINVSFGSLPSFNLGNDTSICARDTLTLNATVLNATSYLWNTGAVTPTIKAFQPGNYWCEVILNGCRFRDSLVIQSVSAAPIVQLGNDTTLCGNNTLTLNVAQANATYLWQNGTTNATLTPGVSGLYWVEVKNASGCTKRDSINIFLKPIPSFSLGADTSICLKDTLTLRSGITMPASYLWSDNTTSSSIKVFQPGLYWCQVEKEGCYFRDSIILVSIKPSPVVSLGSDTTLCEGTTLNLNASYLNAAYLWQDGNINAFYTVNQQGQYRVTLNLQGCTTSDTLNVNYTFKPRFTLGDDLTICTGNTLTLSISTDPLWSLAWQDGSNASSFNATDPGLYTLTATNNCGSTTDALTITKGICTVYIPNAFTPNADGRNDVFKILGTESVTAFNLKIFNRYGQTVFETADPRKGWDGRLKGMSTPMGAFVYIVRYKEMASTEFTAIKGTLLLIR